VTEIISRYFPNLTSEQKDKIARLEAIYRKWNDMINVISRKDIDNFMIHHVLHSLAIAKFIDFKQGTRILDVGTGGGFPGIPLAIIFPSAEFTLLDSIGKKIKVVSEVATELGLKNVKAVNKRVEEEKGKYNFIISRAVTAFPAFVALTSGRIERSGPGNYSNGIIYLKGGDLEEELGKYYNKVEIRNISEYFIEPFFETKKIVYLSI